MTPDLDHTMTQALVCFCTAAILIDAYELAGVFALVGSGFMLVHCISFASRKYRGELYE